MALMADRKKPGVAFWAAVVVVGFAIAYAGSYACLVRQPRRYMLSGVGPWELRPDYEIPFPEQRFWRALFGPAHWLDKRIRPKGWIIQ